MFDRFDYPFWHEDKTIIPATDEVWELFKRIRERINKLQDVIKTQQEIIDDHETRLVKVETHVANKVQKIEIVKMLGETEVPKFEMMHVHLRLVQKLTDRLAHIQQCSETYSKDAVINPYLDEIRFLQNCLKDLTK